MIYFSNNLKLLREKAGKRQSDLATEIGVKPNTVSNYEKGVTQPDFSILHLIVNFFDVTADDMLYKDLAIIPATSRNLILPASKPPEPEINDRYVLDRLFSTITEKEKKIDELQKTITDQAATIGSLESEIKHLKQTTTSAVKEDAGDAGCAAVG